MHIKKSRLKSKGFPGIQSHKEKLNCRYKIILKDNKTMIIEAIAPKAEYFNNFTIKAQVSIKIIAKGHEITVSMPSKQATPFPPLNFNHIGKR